MLLIGDYEIYKLIDYSGSLRPIHCFNFSSMVSGLDSLQLLPPPGTSFIYSETFDLEYGNYILNNNFAFTEMMKVVTTLYNGTNVFLAIRENGSIDEALVESFAKLIQLKYGYNYQMLHSYEDINYDDDSDFSVFGLPELYNDINRLRGMIKNE